MQTISSYTNAPKVVLTVIKSQSEALSRFCFLCMFYLYHESFCFYDIQVEYDLEKSSKDDLQIASSDRIEQSAVPQSMTWYPPITKEHFIVTANDQVNLTFIT